MRTPATSFRAGIVLLCLLLAACEPAAPERLSFAALGSTGTGGLGQRAVAQAVAATGRDDGLDLVLLLGDVFRRDGITGLDDPQWEKKFSAAYPSRGLDLPFYAVAGNRDHRGDVEAMTAYDRDPRWRMPALSYRLDRRLEEDVLVSFVALDTTVLRRSDEAGRAQRRWLAETLAAAAADWLVVFGHDPILRINGELDPALGPLLPLLHRHGLDLYLSGEEQVLGVQRDAAGALHVASGAGAMVSDPPGHAGMEAHVPRQGFVHVRLEPATLRLRLIDRDGTVHYQRRLQRDESGG
jgi:hypothetical protein